jgi:hypothetical protein
VRVPLVAAFVLASAFVALAAPDAGAGVQRSLSASVRSSGHVVVRFHGDAAADCSSLFRCDIRAGTLRWTPARRGDLTLFRVGRSRRGFVFLLEGSDSSARTEARVERAAADGTHVCADSRAQLFGVLPVQVGRAGTLIFGFGGAGGSDEAVEPALFGSTHCSGPLPADVAPGLPRRTVALRALRHGPRTIDLSGSAPFSAGGLTGEVRSTLALHVRRLRPGRERSGGGRRRVRRRKRQPLRTISIEYRIASVSGSVPVDVSANPGSCARYDACGLTGTIAASPGPAGGGEAYVTAFGRVPVAALRRAAGLAPGPVPRKALAYGYAQWTPGRGTVQASLDRGGLPACRDSVALRQGTLVLLARGRRLIASFGSRSTGGDEILRSRCPGPLIGDLRGRTALASASLPRLALGRRRVVLHLLRGASLDAAGYRLRSRPDLTVVLERERIRVHRG